MKKKEETTKKKSSNSNLHKANKAKKDEFYTQLEDISKELMHYKEQFRGKVVFCNCDDPKESNFVKYFAQNFEHLGLKKLIATHYKGAAMLTNDLPYKLEYSGDKNGNRMPDLDEFTTQMLSDGDFRNTECIELLKEADIVVTNPPFSLFIEYVLQLDKFNKNFLIIGSLNSVKYNSIFKLIKGNRCWLGYNNGPKVYQVPIDYEQKNTFIAENGKRYAKMGNTCWFTNLDTSKRHEYLVSYKKFLLKEFKRYDNYNAIEVPKLSEIPEDYYGLMGVPITFIEKYNPDQFQILGVFDDKREDDDAFIKGTPTYVDEQHKKYVGPVLNGKALFTRILIKRKK